MKMMFCHLCGDLVVPDRHDFVSKSCTCGNGAVAWTCGAKGELAMHAEGGRDSISLIGLSNALLRHDMGGRSIVDRVTIEEMLADTPSNYYFAPNHCNSLVIRCQPGYSSDVKFFDDPKEFNAHIAKLKKAVVEQAGKILSDLGNKESEQPKEKP